MRIAISHTTRYRFAQPATHGLQRLRLKPLTCPSQSVLDWRWDIAGARLEAEYEDHNQNATALISFGGGAQEIAVTCTGLVQTADSAGVIGKHTGYMPLWAFLNHTELTRPGPLLRRLAGQFPLEGREAIETLHALSTAILDAVGYETGCTDADTPAEVALAAGRGVCQDHAHIFIGAARVLGVPARYVSGYLLMDEVIEQQASHGWAEAHVAGLGWVGFDVSNAICPDARYVRVAVGADYRDAAPVTGIALGSGGCDLSVELSVQQQLVEQ